MNLRRELESRLSRALALAGGPADVPAMVSPAARPQFGDYQANGMMAAAKALGTNPHQLAEKAAAAAEVSDLTEPLEVAGPGFINIRLKDDFLADELGKMLVDERLGVEPPKRKQTVVVDYSGPNLAKEMHVGHLRSTIIGDCLARTLGFLGHNVIRQNHVGDWGTQFGMLIAHMQDMKEDLGRKTHWAGLEDLEALYREAKRKFDENPDFRTRAGENVVRLQSGDSDIERLWRDFTQISIDHCEKIYHRLGVSLERAHVRGESAYNDDLPSVVADMESAGLLTESQGAQCVFLEEFTGKDGKPFPLIVRKSDGGFLYATTDLAAIRYRVGELGAERIFYVTDSRQSLHFRQVFAVARRAGFAPQNVSLEHIAFGTMMDPNGKPFKTREGGTVKLMDLLDEAEKRAYELAGEKNFHLSAENKRQVARVVGIGAIKYADLSVNRTSDYVFSWEKMLSLEGNTAPYMQYAYARIRSIFRKGGQDAAPSEKDTSRQRAQAGNVLLTHPAERALGLKLLQFPETIAAVATDCLPSAICNYLYALAGAFMGFYEDCPVLKADEPLRTSRLNLCRLTAEVIKRGLNLLGIETIERM